MGVTNIACVHQAELFKEIGKLQKGVKGIKLSQENRIKAIRDEIQDKTKTQISHAVEYVMPGCVTIVLAGFLMFCPQREDRVPDRGCHRLPSEKICIRTVQGTGC